MWTEGSLFHTYLLHNNSKICEIELDIFRKVWLTCIVLVPVLNFNCAFVSVSFHLSASSPKN